MENKFGQMQKPTAPPVQSTATGDKKGRPRKPREKDPTKRTLTALQYALDRANNYIADGRQSYARYAKFAAKRGIPIETVEKGIVAIEACVKDLRTSVVAAYREPTSRAAVVSRASLAT